MHSLLIVGVGSIGHRHLRCFQQTGRVHASICDSNSELLNQLADQYDVQDKFTDLTSAMASRPEIVVISTPAHLHIPMATTAVEAGSHVLVEKPLSTSIDGVDELVERAATRGVTVGVAYVMRHHPLLQQLKQVIDTRRFGQPLQVTVNSGQHFPFYRPAYREIYYTSHETGGGAIQDAITHMVNALQWLLGSTTALVCDAAHLSLPDVDVEDTVHVLIRHGEILGNLSLNQFQLPNETSLTINFEQATVRCDLHSGTWQYCTQPEGDWLPGGESLLERDELFIAQANAFLDAVEQGASPACNLHAAKHTLQTNLAMLASVRDKQWYHIP